MENVLPTNRITALFYLFLLLLVIIIMMMKSPFLTACNNIELQQILCPFTDASYSYLRYQAAFS